MLGESFDKLPNAIDRRSRASASVVCNPQSFALTGEPATNFQRIFDDWLVNGRISRLWARDASLWSAGDESQWLGWLNIIDEQIADRQHLKELAEDICEAGFSDAIVLGMGGSSLCSAVFSLIFSSQPGFPQLHVLDSMDPAQIRTVESKVDITKALFIVASKSGSTLESDALRQYFFDRVLKTAGAMEASKHFIAITDPGSQLEQVAIEKKFRHVFHGVKSIGGRYSALSNFGMVPATVMGIDTLRFLERSGQMAEACSPRPPMPDNPGVALGVALGSLALEGHDKVTILASSGVYDFGVWLEQLLAESTGKCGKGLIPVDREPIGSPGAYGTDRIFVYLRLAGDADDKQVQALEELEVSGQPVIRIDISDVYDLGQEWFRWEIAIAVASSILEINPFNQPDVENSKMTAQNLIDTIVQCGSLPDETPFYWCEDLKLFADEVNASELLRAVGKSPSLVDYLRAHLNRIEPGDYLALLAYIEMNQLHEKSLQVLRVAIRDVKHAATCGGFGPRFLHSTGQVYKGGPNTGVFLQITCDDAVDFPIPGYGCTFGVVKNVQAQSDFEILTGKGRRALRVHLGRDVRAGLEKLETAVLEALR